MPTLRPHLGLKEKVDFTVGFCNTGVAMKALDVFQDRKPYAGVVTTHDRPISTEDHDAFSINMIWMGVWRRGEIQFLYPEDARRATMIRRKQ